MSLDDRYNFQLSRPKYCETCGRKKLIIQFSWKI